MRLALICSRNPQKPLNAMIITNTQKNRLRETYIRSSSTAVDAPERRTGKKENACASSICCISSHRVQLTNGV